MKLREVLKDIIIQEAHVSLDTEIGGVAYDSRAVKPGDLFVAVRGLTADGHRFIGKALENGAAAILCEEAQEGWPCVCTLDCRLGLALASRNFFGDPASQMCMIGITGTNGKTSSCFLMKHLLEHVLHAKVGLIGTNGIMIGDEFLPSDRTTPESYELHRLFRRMLDAGCSHVVMEVSSHSLALERVAGIHYDTAVFSNLTQDHLDFHETMENYAAAKRKLFSMCRTGCFNLDDPWAPFMMDGAQCRKLAYSADRSDADLCAEGIVLSAEGVSFTARYGGEAVPTRLGIPGLFSVHNALGVMAAGLSLGLGLEQCSRALADAKGVKGRVEVVPTGRSFSVLIDYAHTPDALENVLKTLKPLTKGRLIVLFGCGGDRDSKKRPIMGRIAAQEADFCVVTSDNPRTEDPDFIISQILEGMRDSNTPMNIITDREEAIAWALDNAGEGDVILLAGKGHEDYQEVGHMKRHMDEREIVARCLRKH